MMKDKRGISPVVATVLLIGIVVVAAVIIYLALYNFGGEVCKKFNGTCDSACSEVQFDVGFSGGKVVIDNTGNVGIHKLNIKTDEGDIESCTVDVAIGRSKTVSSCSLGDSAIPVILGNDEEGLEVEYVCDDAEEFF